jgi:hypothetical protein
VAIGVDVPLPAIQTKPCGLKAMPQPLTKLGSVKLVPLPSDTRLEAT